MILSEIAIKNLASIGPDATIEEAAMVMRERHVGDVVVIRTGTSVPVGILTDRDIVLGVRMPQKDIMNSPKALKLGNCPRLKVFWNQNGPR